MAYTLMSPFSALQKFERALDATRLSDWFERRTTGTGSFPAINVFSTGEDYLILTEIPGVDKRDIDIDIKGNQIRLKGKKEVPHDNKSRVHHREREAGYFDRTLTVPMEIDAEGVKAEYQDGILAIHLPRAEADKPRSITIN